MEQVVICVRTKPCSRCGLDLPTDHFHKSNKERSGFRPECKACRKIENEVNKSQIQETRRRRYQANKERIKAQNYEYRRLNPEKVRETRRKYDLKTVEKRSAYMKQYRRNNGDKFIAYDEKRKITKRTELKEYYREYRRRKPAHERAKKHNRRAREKAGGKFVSAEWIALCSLFRNRCLRCGRSNLPLTPDHIIPLSKNGSNNIDNIQPLCMPCNSKKGVKIIDYRRPDQPGWFDPTLDARRVNT